MNRRDFLQFLGVSGVISTIPYSAFSKSSFTSLKELAPSFEDKLLTLEGISHNILIRWGDKISNNELFGFNNDYIAIHSLSTSNAIMWVNHEYVNPLFINGTERTKKNVDEERLQVGGSLIEIKKVKGKWELVKDSSLNRRINNFTKIPFAWDEPILNSKFAVGTLANCAGGKTPWGTFLTCEENYDMCFGDRDRRGNKTPSTQSWDKFYPYAPEHYGWVVEINPKTGEAKKLVSLGRCAHECATTVKAKNNNIAVYTGDDANDEHLYKFISNSSSSLERGKLYVANLEEGKWVSLDRNDSPILKKNFKSQTEIQIYTREAAKLVGATPLARPEDIEVDPITGNVFIALTNNKPKGDNHGSILKIIEDNNDYGSLTFKHETFLTGGSNNGFSCPDNLVFDPSGNLWFTSDISGASIGKSPYQEFGNNSLFVSIRSGEHAGKIIRVASAPVDAEFTGPCFSPDYKNLFLSVQHPGEMSPSLKNLTSQWPDGGIPKPSVVTLQGKILDQIVRGAL